MTYSELLRILQVQTGDWVLAEEIANELKARGLYLDSEDIDDQNLIDWRKEND